MVNVISDPFRVLSRFWNLVRQSSSTTGTREMAAVPERSFVAIPKPTKQGVTALPASLSRIGKGPALKGKVRGAAAPSLSEVALGIRRLTARFCNMSYCFCKLKSLTDLTITKVPLALPDSRQAALKHSTTGVSAAEPASAAVALRRMILASTLILALALLDLSASAANVYVRDGGTGNGSAWDNALDLLPSTLVRGNTYYVAAGNYVSSTIVISVPTSGTNQIYIKKATIADHGTNTGWLDTYGVGQAILPAFYIQGGSGYVTFDGQYKYGFRCNVPNGGNVAAFDLGNCDGSISNITFKYLEVVGPADGVRNFAYGANDSPRGIHVWGAYPTYGPFANMLISHCSFRGLLDNLYLIRCPNLIVEYTELSWSSSGTAAAHGNLAIMWEMENATWRYNYLHDFNCEGILCAGKANNWKVYGNVCWGNQSPNANRFLELYESTTTPGYFTNHAIYNNTLVDLNIGIRRMSGVDYSNIAISNNLFYNISGALVEEAAQGANWNRDYNWFSGSSAQGEAHGVAGGTSLPFVATNDFHIVTTISSTLPRDKGASLNTEFNTDPDGVTRGTDGAWDMGAYEYSSGSSTNPVLATFTGTLDFGTLLTGTSSNLTIMVTNKGGRTLTGTASVSGAFRIVSGESYSLSSQSNQPVIVQFNPTAAGMTNQTIVFTSNGGNKNANVTGLGSVLQPTLSFVASAGTILAPFTVSNLSSIIVVGDSYGTISNYLSQSSETGLSGSGQAVYGFNIANAGNYAISALINAPNTGANSFYVNIDGQPTDPTMIWDVPVTSGFTNQLVSWRGTGTDTNNQFAPKVFSLSSGTHQLIVRGREANAQLAGMTISLVPPTPIGLHVISP
jgi:hypothetical protein